MSERPSKERRKEIQRELAAKAREESLAALPADRDELKAFFDRLEQSLGAKGCDHSLRLSSEIIAALGLDETSMKQWFGKSGGYCDCEVMLNVEV